MFRFLPQDTRAHATKIYKERRIFVIVFGLMAVLILTLVELIPLYIISRAKIDVTDAEKKALAATTTPETIILQTVRDVELLQKVTSTPSPLIFQKRLLSLARPGVRLNGFSWKVDEAGVEAIEISGTAGRRESLVAFVKTIQKDTLFTGIDLPVSYLLKEKDIDFVLKGTFTPKK